MGRYTYLVVALLLLTIQGVSQCPDLENNTSVVGCNTFDCDICGSDNITISVSDPNLPSGMIDWYTSPTAGFDPLTQGTLLGSSIISSANPCDQCPSIESIYIDACGPGAEAQNEFFVVGSGSGFAVDELAFEFAMQNTGGPSANGSINIGGVCGWFPGDPSLFTGCTLISIGPGDYVPPNSTVVVQASRLGSTVYDLSGLCGTSDCIYVLSNSCDRNIGGFSNCSGGTGSGSTRTNTLTLSCGCSDMLIYDLADPTLQNICSTIDTDGTHVVSGLIYQNNGCNNGPNIGSISQYSYTASTPDFNFSFDQSLCNSTQYIVGLLNTTQYNQECCGVQETEQYQFDISCAEAELSGGGDLCPGDCVLIDVNFIGGESPYDIDLTFGFPFPIPDITIPFAAFPVDEKITVCFDTSGPIIDFDNFIINVGSIAAGFSGSLTLDAFTDANGCAGTITGGSVSISFNEEPNAVTPPDQEACDLGNGTGAFVLANIANIVNNGSGQSVLFFSDDMGLNPINDPYIGPNATIYAMIDATPCDSELVPVELIVIDLSELNDVGFVLFYCGDSGSLDCTICDDDAITGEMIDLTIQFENPSATYSYEVVWMADNGSSSTITGTAVGSAVIPFNIFTTTTFQVTSVTLDGDCPDVTNLGAIVTVSYGQLPDIDQPSDLENCGSVILPIIMGTIIPPNAAYYTMPNGMGTMYSSGDEITSSTLMYLYAGIDDCDIDYSFDITILDAADIDVPSAVVTCGTYVLPEITGTNVDNVEYYTEIDGGGNILPEGFLISTTTTLYLYDAACGGNQPIIDITITPGPVIENTNDTIVCDFYIVEPIFGQDLNNSEAYFTEVGGTGLMISIGDTITNDSIIYIFTDEGGCMVEIPIIIVVNTPANPGLDSTITLCEGDPMLINLNTSIANSPIDSIGKWIDNDDTNIITDSSMVDLSTLSIGSYSFTYQILDSICVDTSANLTINIIGAVNAGNDGILEMCGGMTNVDLYNLLDNPDQGGQLINELGLDAGFPDLSDATFNDNAPEIALYFYIVGDANSSCGADTSTLTVHNNLNNVAGIDYTTTVCNGSELIITNLFPLDSQVGIFEEVVSSGGLTGNVFNSTGLSAGSYTILHIVNNSTNCPPDTSDITIIVATATEAGNDIETTICGGETLALTSLIDGDF
ncbi:MAG: hypothetical protein V3V14_14550, partial [Saprospiraceae bacterium]